MSTRVTIDLAARDRASRQVARVRQNVRSLGMEAQRAGQAIGRAARPLGGAIGGAGGRLGALGGVAAAGPVGAIALAGFGVVSVFRSIEESGKRLQEQWMTLRRTTRLLEESQANAERNRARGAIPVAEARMQAFIAGVDPRTTATVSGELRQTESQVTGGVIAATQLGFTEQQLQVAIRAAQATGRDFEAVVRVMSGMGSNAKVEQVVARLLDIAPTRSNLAAISSRAERASQAFSGQVSGDAGTAVGLVRAVQGAAMDREGFLATPQQARLAAEAVQFDQNEFLDPTQAERRAAGEALMRQANEMDQSSRSFGESAKTFVAYLAQYGLLSGAPARQHLANAEDHRNQAKTLRSRGAAMLEGAQ